MFAYVGEHPGNTILLGGGSSTIAYGVCIFAIYRKEVVTVRRGTTPTHTFVLPFNVEDVQAIQVIYRQNGENILILEKSDCTLSGKVVSVRLTQEDTFAFKDGTDVEMQIRVLTADGESVASDVMLVSCEKCLTEDVLS